MLTARDLEHGYGRGTAVAVDHVALAPGEMTGLVGPNGSGKSTLLRLLAFLEHPRRGTFTLDGTPVVTRAERRRARRRVTLVEQAPLLFAGSVRSNLRDALRLHGVRGAVADGTLEEALERVGVVELVDRPARALSGGETQRVAVARALALRPAVLLLDEPASAADRAAANQLYAALQTECARGAAVCFSSHQLEDAYRWSSRIVALADGRAGNVTPENLFRAVLPPGAGVRTVRLGTASFVVVTDKTGPATIAIAPEDIILSREPLHASVRNTLTGRVIRLAEDGRGGIAVTVDAGVTLTARITAAAVAELGLAIGAEVVVSVKATAVRVY